MSDSIEAARAVAARINKQMKIEDLVVVGADAKALRPGFITTGILALDVALGGGWPTNRWSEVIGTESSGKTAAVLRTIAANQKLDPDWIAVWIAAEELDAAWAERLGVDLDRFFLVDTNVMQDAYDIVIQYLESKVVDCIVIDSLPALVPIQEDEASMDDTQVSLGARLTAKFFRKARKAGARSIVREERPVTGILINQWRDAIGAWAPPGQTAKTTPGGKAKNYSFFTRVEIARTEWKKQGDEKVGQAIKAIVVKNKAAAPQRQANWDFYFVDCEAFDAGEVDEVKDVFNTALALGVIEKNGAWFSYGDLKAQGRDQFFNLLDEHLDVVDQIWQETISRLRPLTVDLPEVEEMEEPDVVEEAPVRKVVKRKSK